MFYSCKFSFASHFQQLLSKENLLSSASLPLGLYFDLVDVIVAIYCLAVVVVRVIADTVAGRGSMDASHPVNLTHGSPAQQRYPSQVLSAYSQFLLMSCWTCWLLWLYSPVSCVCICTYLVLGTPVDGVSRRWSSDYGFSTHASSIAVESSALSISLSLFVLRVERSSQN